jgi:acyl-CoA synthetase (NDP forming)
VGLRSTEEVARAADQVWAGVRAAQPQASLDGLLVQQMVTGPTLECLVGVVRDPQAGLVVSVAAGGVLVELLGEVPSFPVPVSHAQAESLIDAGPLAKLLRGYRGQQPFDRDALVEAVVSFSRLAAAYGPDCAAAEINPLLVRPRGHGVVAVDCLIVKEAR